MAADGSKPQRVLPGPRTLLRRLLGGGEAILEAWGAESPNGGSLLPGEEECPSGKSWWDRVGGAAAAVRDAGFCAVLLPPFAKGGSGAESRGFDVYDFYDFGGLEQRGGVPTRWGAEDELRRAVQSLRSRGVNCLCDVATTTCSGGNRSADGTFTDFGAVASRRFKRDRGCFHPCEYSEDGAHAPALPDTESVSPAALCLTHPHVRQQVAVWANHVAQEFGVDGVRWCAAESVPAGLVTEVAEAEHTLSVHIAWPSWSTGTAAERNEAALRWVRDCPAALAMDVGLWGALMDCIMSPDASAPVSHLLTSGLSRCPDKDVVARSVVFVSCAGVEREMLRRGVTPDRRLLSYAYVLGAGRGVPMVSLDDYCVHGLSRRIDRLLDVLRSFGKAGEPAEEVVCEQRRILLKRPAGAVLPSVGVYQSPGCYVAINASSAEWSVAVSADDQTELVDVADPAVEVPAAAEPREGACRCLRRVCVDPGSYVLLVPVPV